jgi:hypothetical protein
MDEKSLIVFYYLRLGRTLISQQKVVRSFCPLSLRIVMRLFIMRRMKVTVKLNRVITVIVMLF